MPQAGLGAAIVEVSGNLPYDVQRLAHETWDDVVAARRRRVTLDDVHATLSRLLAEQDVFFEGMWERLTLLQRAALRAIVHEDGVSIMSADTIARYRMTVASSIQISIGRLLSLEIVHREDDGRYTVVDSLMREWVARKTY